MLIEGAIGARSGIVNGGFDVAEWPDNEPPIYRRFDGSDGWLFVNVVDKWTVGDQQDKDARKTLRGRYLRGRRAQSVEEAAGRLPHEVGTEWQVFNGNRKTLQQLRLLHGEEAEVVIAQVSVYEHTIQPSTQARAHASAHTHAQGHIRPISNRPIGHHSTVRQT